MNDDIWIRDYQFQSTDLMNKISYIQIFQLLTGLLGEYLKVFCKINTIPKTIVVLLRYIKVIQFMSVLSFILSLALLLSNVHPKIVEENIEQSSEQVSFTTISTQKRELKSQPINTTSFGTTKASLNRTVLSILKTSIRITTPLYLRHRILLI